MPRPYRFSTTAVPAAERLKSWNETCEKHCGAKVVNTDSLGFQGTLTTFCADQLRISSFWSTPATCRNTQTRGSRADVESPYSLQLVHVGRCHIRHAGIDSIGVAGDMLVADARQSYELDFSEPVQGLVVSLPGPRFMAYESRLQARAGKLLDVQSGPGAVLANFIRLGWEQLTDGEPQQWPRSATEVIWDLLESMLQDENERAIPVGRPDRIRRDARVLVEDNYRNSDFQSAELAAKLGVSARSLQIAFAEVGTTPSRFLIARRLDGVADRLKLTNCSVLITEVALECGFSDISYFSRMFRRRFGVSARAFRQRAIAWPCNS
jgi:AraC-like DNA-binding protein